MRQWQAFEEFGYWSVYEVAVDGNRTRLLAAELTEEEARVIAAAPKLLGACRATMAHPDIWRVPDTAKLVASGIAQAEGYPERQANSEGTL